MKDQINKIINDYYRRLVETDSGRWFDKDFLTTEMLSDQQLTRDIIDLARDLSKVDKREKQV